MVNLRADLKYDTPADWTEVALSDFPVFLQEHANMERKASAQAMSFVVKYPNRTEIIPTMIETALEELEHFQQVYERMATQGIALAPDTPDEYVNDLLKACRNGREERFIDRMIVASIVETRGAERFRLVYEALEDPDWKAFYRDLWATEAKHGNIFLEMLLHYHDFDTVYLRTDELLTVEAEICERLPWRASLH